MASRGRGTADQPRYPGLQISEDFGFQKRAWAWQLRLQWVFLAFIAGGLLGVFGGGPPTFHVRTGSGGLEVEHPRFLRWQAPFDWECRIGPGLVRQGVATLWLDESLLEAFELEQITPEPAEQSVRDGRIFLRFDSTVASEPVTIMFRMKPDKFGLVEGAIGAEAGPRVPLRLFTFP